MLIQSGLGYGENVLSSSPLDMEGVNQLEERTNSSSENYPQLSGQRTNTRPLSIGSNRRAKSMSEKTTTEGNYLLSMSGVDTSKTNVKHGATKAVLEHVVQM